MIPFSFIDFFPSICFSVSTHPTQTPSTMIKEEEEVQTKEEEAEGGEVEDDEEEDGKAIHVDWWPRGGRWGCGFVY